MRDFAIIRAVVSESEFFDFAAAVFGVSPARLSFETSLGLLPEWDSMAQLRLVMEIQSKFGVEIPFADVPNATSLWELYRRVNGLSPKKAIAVDLDNTLWEGVAAEDGEDQVKPNLPLQRKLRELKERGVLLIALSKNNIEDVRGLVEGFGDFVTWRIDWGSKADNLADVAAELNIGTDAFVFVDDDPAERIEMKSKLPSVAVASFPPNLDAYFPCGTVTAEDRAKTEEYRAEAKRREWVKESGGLGALDIWKELGAWIDVRELSAEDVPRVAQLSQKANQFNVCTNRHDEGEVRGWLAAAGGGERVFTVRSGDRFGGQGLVAFVRVVPAGAAGRVAVADWTMSCRVAGRGLEERAWAEIAGKLGRCTVEARWLRTAKNAPVENLFERLGFDVVESGDWGKRYECVLG